MALPPLHSLARLLCVCAAVLGSWLAAPGHVAGAEADTPIPPLEIRETEQVFVCCIFGENRSGPGAFADGLKRISAVQQGEVWCYTNAAQHKAYLIHLVHDAKGMVQALYTDKAHVIIDGHSNFGLGAMFANEDETRTQTVTQFRYIDDERLLSYGSPWTSVNVPKFLSVQSYPEWWPVFKDGASAIMPYDFNDPRGPPPYNYYLTYQLPGDPVHYKFEYATNGGLERFPGCGRPAWYAPDGSEPDAHNPDHRKYFITNTNAGFEAVGKWLIHACTNGCCGTNYLWTSAGDGHKQVRWRFSLANPGTYSIMAGWPASTQNVSSACFSIVHAQGTTIVRANQQTNGGQWNLLGTFQFDAGEYSVSLTDKPAEGTGKVIADGIRILCATNTCPVDVSMDNGPCPKPHYLRKTIVFRRQLDVDPAKLRYARLFYDGCLSAVYYPSAFHHGVMFYTVNDSYLSAFETYLREYMHGASDPQIWAALQNLQTLYDYFDFSRPPQEQDIGRTAVPVAPPTAYASRGGFTTQWGRYPASRVFDLLRRPEFVQNEPMSRRIVLAAFSHRREPAIEYALEQLTRPLIDRNEELRVSRIRGVLAARRILEAFPEQAVPRLLADYEKATVATKGNLLRASGKLTLREPVKALLLRTLADSTVCDDATWQVGGDPLRLCDVAYNQLVLQCGISGVVRTLCPSHTITARDYQIQILKAKL